MQLQGIDVSKHQGIIQWPEVKKAGIQFAILRAGYGKVETQQDAQFERNYAECIANEIPVGAYWYSYAMSPEEAKQEAAICLQVIRNKTFSYPIYLDMEEKQVLALGKSACTAIAETFLKDLEQAGYFVGLYSSKSHLETYFTEALRERYAVWVAHYGVSKTSYTGQYGIWQHSSTGSVAGITGNVDCNWCYTNYPAIMQQKGLNGYFVDSTSSAAPKASWKSGQAVQLQKEKTQLFANETTKTPAGYLPPGTYYLYDGKVCKNGRYRITTKPEFCEKEPAGSYVTGYVSLDNFS